MTRSLYAMLFLCGISGCASGPFAELVPGAVSTASDPRVFPVEVVLPRSSRLDVGTHQVVVRSTRPGATGRFAEQATYVTVEACKRYFLVARYETALARDWQLEVAEVQDIPGCDDTG